MPLIIFTGIRKHTLSPEQALVERIATSKHTFAAALAKHSRDGATVQTGAFLQILSDGFQPGETTGKDWEELRYIADPFR